VLATAAAVAVVAAVHDGPAEPGPAGHGTDQGADAGRGSSTPVYYVGDSPRGPKLFRSFEPEGAALDLVAGTPSDPDYRTLWSPGRLLAASVPESGEASVALAGVPAERPSGLSAGEAELALQQVVYTLQASWHERAGVVFTDADGEPLDRVLGVDTSRPVTNDPDVLSQVSISDPVEGREVSGSFTARGVANSVEANVPWEIRRGDTVVAHGFATAEGWMDRLYPWETTVDVTALDPGTYTFVAMTDDPSGGAEGHGPESDTRTIVIR
jgi:hypothetical protein